MSKDIRELFETTRVVGLLPGLEDKVLLRLEQEQKKRWRQNLVFFGIVDVFSIAGLVAVFYYLINLMTSSGFYYYLSLLWLDQGALAFYWQEALLSIVESLPWLGLTIFLMTVFVAVFSLVKTFSSFRLAGVKPHYSIG